MSDAISLEYVQSLSAIGRAFNCLRWHLGRAWLGWCEDSFASAMEDLDTLLKQVVRIADASEETQELMTRIHRFRQHCEDEFGSSSHGDWLSTVRLAFKAERDRGSDLPVNAWMQVADYHLGYVWNQLREIDTYLSAMIKDGHVRHTDAGLEADPIINFGFLTDQLIHPAHPLDRLVVWDHEGSLETTPEEADQQEPDWFCGRKGFVSREPYPLRPQPGEIDSDWLAEMRRQWDLHQAPAHWFPVDAKRQDQPVCPEPEEYADLVEQILIRHWSRRPLFTWDRTERTLNLGSLLIRGVQKNAIRVIEIFDQFERVGWKQGLELKGKADQVYEAVKTLRQTCRYLTWTGSREFPQANWHWSQPT